MCSAVTVALLLMRVARASRFPPCALQSPPSKSDRFLWSSGHRLFGFISAILTHFGYVHASTFKITDWVDPPKVAVEGDKVTFSQSFVESPLPPPFAAALGVAPGTPFNRENHGSFVSPALQVAAVDFIDPRAADKQAIAGRFRIAHATTPINGTSMLYYYTLGRDHGTSPQLMQGFETLSKIGFDEDKRILEAIQAARLKDPRDPAEWEVSVKSDAAGVQARRALARWMERETDGAAA